MSKYKKPITPKVFEFDVYFKLQVLATTKEDAEKICETQGGFQVSRTQVCTGFVEVPEVNTAS